MRFRLRKKIKAHSSDVRGLVTFEDDSILSVSRDGTYSINRKGSDGLVNSKNFPISKCFVNSVLYISPDKFVPESIFSNFEQGLIIIGLSNGTCACYDFSGECKHTFEGQSNNISCLAFNERCKLIYSGSWDHTIKSYSMVDGKVRDSLIQHTNSVWCLESVTPYKLLLSGSADKSIILWKGNKPMRFFMGHSQPVRAIQILSSRKHFISSGNDCLIKKWIIDSGDCLETLDTLKSFVFSISLRNETFVTVGEEGFVTIWEENRESQLIVVPCNVLWDVKWMSNDEFAVACSDGSIRLYSSKDDFEEENEVDNAILDGDKSKNDDLENSKQLIHDPNVPDITNGLAKIGFQDGEITLVKNRGKVEVYEWSMKEKSWKLCGDVITDGSVSVPDNNKHYFNGKEYDYIFDVDFEGLRSLKLPYNKGEDPWVVAKDFCEVNELPITYMEQIVSFIKTNTSNDEDVKSTISEPVYKPRVEYISFIGTNYAGLMKRLKNIESRYSEHVYFEAIYGFLEAILSGKDEKSYVLEIQPEHVLILFCICEVTDLLPAADLLRILSSYPTFSLLFDKDEMLKEIFTRFCFSEVDTDQLSRMLLLRALCNIFNDFSKSVIYPVCLFQDLNRALLSPHMWADDKLQIAASASILNFLIYMTRKNFDCGILWIDICDILVWIFDVLDQNLCVEAKEILLDTVIILIHEKKSNIEQYMPKFSAFAASCLQHGSVTEKIKRRCECILKQ